MKKMETLTLMAIVAMMSLTMISCDDEHFDHYYFDLDEALDAYFETYGDFGTDDRTTAQWFDHYCAYASDRDYRDFLNAVDYERYENQKLMAKYLNGYWTGPMTMYYKDNMGATVSTPCTVAWDFELDAKSDISGRGLETRVIEGEGTVETAFSWMVNAQGGIELSFDGATADSDPIYMLVAYDHLDQLSPERFKGTAVGVNIDEEDDFDLKKQSYAKPSVATRSAVAKTFCGKGKPAAAIERNIVKAIGHR